MVLTPSHPSTPALEGFGSCIGCNGPFFVGVLFLVMTQEEMNYDVKMPLTTWYHNHNFVSQ